MNDIEIARKFMNKAGDAQKRNIPFMLGFSDYKRLLRTKRCYYTGVEMTFEEGQPNSFSIDRVDASKGYIPGNVVACTVKFNQKKKDLTMDDLRMIFKKIKRRL